MALNKVVLSLGVFVSLSLGLMGQRPGVSPKDLSVVRVVYDTESQRDSIRLTIKNSCRGCTSNTLTSRLFLYCLGNFTAASTEYIFRPPANGRTREYVLNVMPPGMDSIADLRLMFAPTGEEIPFVGGVSFLQDTHAVSWTYELNRDKNTIKVKTTGIANAEFVMEDYHGVQWFKGRVNGYESTFKLKKVPPGLYYGALLFDERAKYSASSIPYLFWQTPKREIRLEIYPLD